MFSFLESGLAIPEKVTFLPMRLTVLVLLSLLPSEVLRMLRSLLLVRGSRFQLSSLVWRGQLIPLGEQFAVPTHILPYLPVRRSIYPRC